MLTLNKTIKAAVVSDQVISMRGLASLVISMPWVDIIGEAASVQEAAQLCKLCHPDILLLDLHQPYEKICEAVCQVRSICPTIQVIVMVGSPEECRFEEEGKTGQLFYLSRDVSEAEFNSALEQVRKMASPEGKDDKAGTAYFEHQPYPEGERNGPESDAEGRTQRQRNEALTRELALAGKIQEEILPEEVPAIAGWDISALIVPARETSGDFYDFIPVSERKWGLVIADVTDKGMGAALFMVLCNTLIRTYASRFPTLPALALNAVSERILADTRSGMFVTAFFGILETHTGRFTFANAGHPPGYLIRPQRYKDMIDQLRPTGMALGVSEDARWRQKEVRIGPGDFLVLYTDGITEAQNPQGDFFGEDRLLDIILSKVGCGSRDIQDTLLDEVNQFCGGASRSDDIAMIVIRREE